ncbi:MAG: hypothetical protein AB1Z98_20835 [Nannocystaceae bacterium]
MTLLAAPSRSAVAGPSAATAERPVELELDLTAIAAADAPHIERFVYERSGPILHERAYVVTPRSEDRADAIVVRVDYVDADDLEYAIHVEVLDDGETIEPGIDWFVCQFCPQDMVADAIAGVLPAALELLESHERAAAEERAALDARSSSPEHHHVDEPRRDSVASIGWLGVTGVVVASGGVAMVTAGAVELARGPVIEPSRGSTLRSTDYRMQGRWLVGAGAGAVLLGTAAVVVDVVRRKRRNGLALSPTWLPYGAGLSVSRRF